MNHLRLSLPIAALSLAAGTRAQSPVYGVVETYFGTSRTTPGAVHRLTWGEFNWRPVNDLKLTYSVTIVPNNHFLDEVCAAWQKNGNQIRLGRFRTAFGFNNWSELLYNGFNHIPLIRMTGVTGYTYLTRDDSGIEFTTSVGGIQVQAAAIDTSLERDQITPDNIDTGSLRMEAPIGPFILGLDAMKRLRHEQGIYGFDLRYTAPHIVSRLEYFNGNGKPSSNGYYADVQYRLPGFPRTSLVGMTEMLDSNKAGNQAYLHTVGVRQIVNPNFALNVNYGWGTGLDNVPAIRMQGLDNWSLRAMFQIQF